MSNSKISYIINVMTKQSNLIRKIENMR